MPQKNNTLQDESWMSPEFLLDCFGLILMSLGSSQCALVLESTFLLLYEIVHSYPFRPF